MTLATKLLLFISTFLFLQFHLFYKAEAAEMHHQHHRNVVWDRTSCSDSFRKDWIKGPNVSTVVLRLSHRDGPCSPLLNKNRRNESAATSDPINVLLQDQSRVRYLHSKSSSKSKPSPAVDPMADVERLPANLGRGNFIVTVGLGTPKRDLSLEFDTGSDLTWTKCGTEQEFDPSQSSSFSTVPCGSSACTYSIQYGDKSYTQGVVAQDTLTLSPQDVLPNFLFGCGQNNQGFEGRTGLLGLGRGRTSLVLQSSQKFGEVFSYCLPSTRSSTGYLALGASGGDEGVQFTPLLTGNSPTFYYISLEGISVGGQRLPITPSVFQTSGTIIDSGTVISRLPSSAYASLRDAFRQAMSQNNYPSAQPLSRLLDTCYDFSGQTENVQVPSITLHFGGNVDLELLDLSSILFRIGESQACLAFAGNDDENAEAIFGNTQQKTFKVVYDVAGGKVGFGPKGCA